MLQTSKKQYHCNGCGICRYAWSCLNLVRPYSIFRDIFREELQLIIVSDSVELKNETKNLKDGKKKKNKYIYGLLA